MKFRSSTHNTTHIPGDKIKVIRTFMVNDSILVERNIHTKLKGLALEGEQEFFMCPFDLLENIVDLIIHNDDEENEMVNKIIDTVFKLKQQRYNPIDWMAGIPADVFKETITINQGEKKLAEFDVTLWSETRKKEFVEFCIKEYVKEQNGINDETFYIGWKALQCFLMEHLNISKSKFKVADWKPHVKSTAEKEKLAIKWKSA